MFILTQFIFRLSFGLALGMAVTPPQRVTSGYYRNHLYVLLGLNVLATMVSLSVPEQFFWLPPLSAAVLSYLGSVAWLYEKPKAGIALLVLVALVSIWGAWSANDPARPPFQADATADVGPADSPATVAGQGLAWWLRAFDPVTGGLVLGLTMAAMFLGHWYLNTPTMVIEPLERLVKLMGAAILARAAFCGLCLTLILVEGSHRQPHFAVFLALRWLSGLIGAGLLAAMAWQTLKIPNTQSATGILYAAVIATFLGELASMLMSQSSVYPL